MRTRRDVSPAQENLDTLRAEHESLEFRLNQLDRHRSLSQEERFEIQVIKKRKLALKDRISHMEEQ